MVTSTQTALAREAGKQRSRLAFAKRKASRALLISAEAQVTTDAAAALSERAQRLGDTGTRAPLKSAEAQVTSDAAAALSEVQRKRKKLITPTDQHSGLLRRT